MTEEYQSIINNYVWEIVPRPKRKDVISSKWIYKIKHVVDGIIETLVHMSKFATVFR
jgi:hypothetical protein